MKQDTWNLLEQQFDEFPETRAEAEINNDWEVEELSLQIGIPFPADYAEFVKRYLGAVVGEYEIVGLRPAEFMSSEVETVVDLTMHFRFPGWPGTREWIVFSMDQAGNPIGLDKDGMVWLSDYDSRKIVAICRTFEEFLRTRCLSVDPESSDYYAELPWPADPPFA